MMWLVLLVVAGVAVILISRAMSRETQDRFAPPPQLDRPTPTPALGAPPAERVPGNVLQPFSPIPLTIEGGSPEIVASLREALEDETRGGRDRHERLLEWLLTTNTHIKEIDAFINVWGPRFAATVKEICESDPDWASAGELDRDDIRDGASQKAVERFDIRVEDLKYGVIAEAPALAATADDALLARYGFAVLSFYLRHAGDLDRVHVVPSDDWYRPRFELLVAKGLAKRGSDVDLQPVLRTLTLKEMEAVAEGLDHKRFTRKAPAIEFLSALPDLRERLGRHISLRELFQPLPLPPEFSHIDLAALSHVWAYAIEYAKLLSITYATAARAQQTVTKASIDEHAKGWLVEASYGDEPCCPFCAKQSGERRGSRSAPKLPHHVGCSCHLSQIYEYSDRSG